MRMDSSRLLRLFVALGVLFAAAAGVLADDATRYALQSQYTPGEVTHVEAAMEVGGDLKLVADGAPKQLPMSVVANLKYDEQLLAVDELARPVRSLRYYDEARAVIKVDQGGEKPNLDPTRRLVAVEKPDRGAAVMYCPTEAMRREDLDLIDIPGNTLLVDRLLPAEPVTPGQKWKLSDDVLANLLGLDAVSWSDVESMLGAVAEGIADISAGGSISGAVGGVSTEIEFKARYRFDLDRKQITYLALLIKEKRSVGHIGPGLDTVAKVLMKITPIASSERLTIAAAKTPALSPELARLSFAPPKGQYWFQYDRRWYVTSDEPKLAVMRLIDRGELVAQCNLSALPSSKTTPTLAEFQKDVQNTLGKSFGQFVNASQSTSEAGYTVLRVVAHGVVSELPIEWVYYLVADSRGQRVSLAFTYEQSLTERFAQADRTLVAQLHLNDPATPTTARRPQK